MCEKISLKDLTFNLVKSLETTLSNYYNINCLGLEVSFINNKRRADILAISEGNILIAFEIKSDFDNLKRLPIQIKNYTICFDYVYIVVTKKYLNKVLNNNNYLKTGIILCENCEKFTILRKAKKNSIKDNKYLLFLSKSDKEKINNLENLKIKEFVINILKNKFLPTYNDFKQNFIPPYTETQLECLTSKNKFKYFSGF